MKKDKKWLKEQIERLSYTPKGLDENSSIISKNWVLNFIDKLDEPETLSQEWIDENKVERINNVRKMTTSDVVTVEKLENLLVPKQEIRFEQAHDKLKEESILSEKSFDYYWNCINDNVEIDGPGNLLVPKQDKPVIPQFIADYIEKWKHQGLTIYEWFSFGNNDVDEDIEKWLYDNTIVENTRREYLLFDAIRFGYEVEKEKRYFIIEPVTGQLLIRDDSQSRGVKWADGFSTSSSYFTEKEIKAIDERYWVFAEEVTE